MEAVECGAACLTMILRYYGYHAELNEIREATGVSRDGLSAKTLAQTARRFGLVVKAGVLEPNELATVEHPAIIHWEMNHFVVFSHHAENGVHILDPAIGPRLVSHADVDTGFTGVCLQFSPGENFKTKARQSSSLARYSTVLREVAPALLLLATASVFLNFFGLSIPLGTQVIVDYVLSLDQRRWLPIVGASATALVVGQLVVAAVRGLILSRVRQHVDTKMGSTFVRHLFTLPMRVFVQRHTADLVSRIQGIRLVRELMSGSAVTVLVDGGLLLFYLFLILAFEWRLGLIVGGGVALYCAIYALLRPVQLAAFREKTIKHLNRDVELYQVLNGIYTLKSAGRESDALDRWLQKASHANNASIRETQLQNRATVALFSIRVAAPAAVLIVGTSLALDGRLSLGGLLGAQLLQGAIFGPLERVIQTLLRLQELPFQLERMDDILVTEAEESGAIVSRRLKGEIAFRDVTFAYGATMTPSIEGVSFRIRPGEKIALVGPSGSGKSTLGRLLTALYRPTSGTILIDGQNLATIDIASVRQQIGVVLQETHIFEGTIAENIALHHRQAPLVDIVNAARVAQIHDDIEEMALGYRTKISASACPLSGGQRQRLALARAILHRPAIMLLDEATSALDAVTEAAVEHFLASRLCTRIVIAHRLSTVRDADRIFVLDKGRIVEEGNHTSLLAQGGVYASLISKERVEEEVPLLEEAPRSVAEFVSAYDLERFKVLAGSELIRGSLARIVERRKYPAGAPLIEQGERRPGLFLIERGHVDVTFHEPGLKPYRLDEAKPGDAVGELSLLDGSSSSIAATAREDTRVLYLSPEAFESLRASRDALAAELILGLGRIAAHRLQMINERYTALVADVAPESRFTATDSEVWSTAFRISVSTPETSRRSLENHAMDLSETPLGSSLTEPERRQLLALGEVIRFDQGSIIFRAGDLGDRIYLVLAGRVGLTLRNAEKQVYDVKAGGLFGEVSFFTGGARAAGCHTLESTTLFSIRHDVFLDGLRSGEESAWKLLRHLVHSLSHTIRVGTLRLREAAARASNELDAAEHVRAEAARLAQEEDAELALLARGETDRVPVVRETDPQFGAAACLTAVLRFYRRGVRKGAVLEACRAGATVTAYSLSQGAKSFGMAVRTLTATASELRHVDAPLVTKTKVGEYLVLEGWRDGMLVAMDPRHGYVSFSPSQVEALLSDELLEIVPGDQPLMNATLGKRLLTLLGERKVVIFQMVLTTLLLQTAALATPMVTGFAISSVLPAGDHQLLHIVAMAMTAVLIGEALTSFARSQAALYLRTHVDRSLQEQLLGHILRLPITFFEKHPPGEVVQHFEALSVLRSLLGTDAMIALLDVPSAVITVGYLLVLDPALFGIAMGALLYYFLVFSFVTPRLRRLATEEFGVMAKQRGHLMETLSGLPTLRLTGDAEAAVRIWEPTFHHEVRLGARQDLASTLQMAAVQFGRALTLTLVMWWGALRVQDGRTSLAALVAFAAMTGGFLSTIENLLGHLSGFLRGGEALDRLRSTFGEAPEQGADSVVPPGKLRGSVTLENVSFGYEDGPKILKGISLQIAPGSKVALVGGSGAGKSTLGRLLLGFYMPDAGRVLYDGHDLRGLDLQRLRRQFGVVLQESYLFAGSIRDNLSLGTPGIPFEKLVDAAKKAAIHDEIEAIPMGYETLVSEGGASFSGGQRQRLALARALAHDPAIVLLDEATSALDNLAQQRVERALAKLACTRIVIAHRLSTVVDADQIVVMHRGEIVEVGKHDELLARRGYYARLMEAQL